MDDEDKKHSDQFDASLPLPIQGKPKKDDSSLAKVPPAAVELIRKKVEAAYTNEPDAKEEIAEVEDLAKSKRSKHQEFIYKLTSSGKPLHEIQTAWHEYYLALPEAEKHEVWQEFYSANAHASHYAEGVPKLVAGEDLVTKIEHDIPRSQMTTPATSRISRRLRIAQNRPKPDSHDQAAGRQSPWHSLAFGLSVGIIVVIIFLFSFFNERFIAPFIQPSRDVSNTPLITTGAVISPNPEIIIPKINVQIPVIYNVDTIDETAVENALNDGVVHYADTALPGQNGNVVIVGHSSNNIFNPGKYKFAFVLLSKLDSGDTFYLDKDGKRYTYEVYKKEIVSPNDVSVLGLADKPATASLITCDPPGTSNNRLVVTGVQIDPNPVANAAQATTNQLATSSQIIPGNSPTLWSRLVKWLEE